MKRKERFAFRGTLMEGPEIDLIALAGLTLTNVQEKLWDHTNQRELLSECLSCEEILVEKSDKVPGLSDSYFEYRCDDRAQLVKELREAIEARLTKRRRSGRRR